MNQKRVKIVEKKSLIKYGCPKGHTIWFCKACQRGSITSSKPSSEDIQAAHEKGNLTLQDVADKFHISVRTVSRYLAQNISSKIITSLPQDIVLLMDTTYWRRNFGVVIFKDAISGCVVWHKFISHKETIADYEEGISFLEQHRFKIQAIVSDGVMGLKERLSQYPFQHCQFHQIMTIRHKLTLHPKLLAGQELLYLTYQIPHLDRQTFSQKSPIGTQNGHLF